MELSLWLAVPLTAVFLVSTALSLADLLAPGLTPVARVDALLQALMNLVMIAMPWSGLWRALCGVVPADALAAGFLVATVWFAGRAWAARSTPHGWHCTMHAAMMLVMAWMAVAMAPARMDHAMAAMPDMSGMEGMRMTMTTGLLGLLGVAATALMIVFAGGCAVRIPIVPSPAVARSAAANPADVAPADVIQTGAVQTGATPSTPVPATTVPAAIVPATIVPADQDTETPAPVDCGCGPACRADKADKTGGAAARSATAARRTRFSAENALATCGCLGMAIMSLTMIA